LEYGWSTSGQGLEYFWREGSEYFGDGGLEYLSGREEEKCLRRGVSEYHGKKFNKEGRGMWTPLRGG
jgi:hypothetical protein